MPVPDGWHVRRESKPDSQSLFISKENIEERGGFLTGFSLNTHPRFEARTGMSPLAYAQGIANTLHKSHRMTTVSATTLKPGVDVIEILVTDDSRLPVTQLVYFAVADAPADTFHLAWFETPESIADTEWQHGTRLMNEFIRHVAAGRIP
ncbi:MAG: hypothetical protein A2579_03670 [Lysobacterales bacterium RIFOXYD1_FULL_69_11]|nr:MAG: hypothetical protein A2579_03670 [Xanthomonadales bacterium RIFOXYD1_FULL_69_11]